MRLIHLALREAEDVLAQAHLKEQHFLGRQCLPVALVFLLETEKYKGAAETDTTTAPRYFHGNKRMFCLLYTHTCESSVH